MASFFLFAPKSIHFSALCKAEFAEEDIFFTNKFPSLKTFVNKKVGIWKNKANLKYFSSFAAVKIGKKRVQAIIC